MTSVISRSPTVPNRFGDWRPFAQPAYGLRQGTSQGKSAVRLLSPAAATSILLIVAIIFGGGTYQRSWPDAIVQLISLPIIGYSSWLLATRWSVSWIRVALLVASLTLALPLLQLVPLPPDLWTKLPGRGAIADQFRGAGVAIPWYPLSLSPAETWRSALGLLPPLAMFLSALGLDRQGRRHLSILLIVSAFLCVLIGLAQMAAGADGPFRLYGPGTGAVGFFINSNHYAALLYAAIPFTAAWIIALADQRAQMLVGILLCLLVMTSLLLGLGMAGSRAGLALAMLAGLASLGLARSGVMLKQRNKATGLLVLGGFVGALLIFQFALLGILQHLEADPLADERWTFTHVTFQAARDFLPFGAGLGTFDSIYDAYETNEMLAVTYLNNAHNDFAEVFLEGGVAAAMLVAFVVGYLGFFAVRRWLKPPDRNLRIIDVALGRAATIVVLLLLLHSAVDYPLRSAALSSVFAFSCALILPAHEPDRRRRRRPRTRRRQRELGHDAR